MINRQQVAWAALSMILLLGGCADQHGREHAHPASGERQPAIALPDTRTVIVLSEEARRTHRAVMQQHLESVQQVVGALAEEDYPRAARLTEAHLGFFMHRQAMAGQKPEDFPPAYHDLAMAHHEAAEELARIIPTGDLKRIMPKLDALLKACVACHLAYRVGAGSG